MKGGSPCKSFKHALSSSHSQSCSPWSLWHEALSIHYYYYVFDHWVTSFVELLAGIEFFPSLPGNAQEPPAPEEGVMKWRGQAIA